MTEEYYGKNLFGETVNVGFEEAEEDERFALAPKEREFNIFQLTDALSARDKRNAWIIYERALASGMAADEVYWRVMWGVKALLLASKTDAESSGLNPFVYKKAKANLRNWKTEELEKLSETLVLGYHDARRGIGEIETLIEKTLLNL
jgi:DNA polymerase III delta subunit